MTCVNERINELIDDVAALRAQNAELAAALEEAVEAITPPWNEKKEAAVRRARAALAAAQQPQ